MCVPLAEIGMNNVGFDSTKIRIESLLLMS